LGGIISESKISDKRMSIRGEQSYS